MTASPNKQKVKFVKERLQNNNLCKKNIAIKKEKSQSALLFDL